MQLSNIESARVSLLSCWTHTDTRLSHLLPFIAGSQEFWLAYKLAPNKKLLQNSTFLFGKS